MNLTIPLLFLFLFSVSWVVGRSIISSLSFDSKRILNLSSPFISGIPIQTFYVLLSKALNREDLVESYYENRLLGICKILIEQSIFRLNDDDFNQILLNDIYKVCTVDIILFSSLRRKDIENALPLGLRKINWHAKLQE